MRGCIEIPTPRWTAYDQKRFDVKMADERADDRDRARLYLADLVHAVILLKARPASTVASWPVWV